MNLHGNVKLFKNRFFVERLTSKESNKKAIETFKSDKRGVSIERYLKENAWNDDLEGETKFFLIKNYLNEIAAFFSIKCGLLYKEKNKLYYENKEEEEFYLAYKDAYIKRNPDYKLAVENTYDKISYQRKEVIKKYIIDEIEREKELNNEPDGERIYRVEETFSAIEICHFCKNLDFKYDESSVNFTLGAGLFWLIIIPKIQIVISEIGCKYLYLFAADNSKDKTKKSLINYYKTDLKFTDCVDVKIIKPDYDVNCLSLIQEVKELNTHSLEFINSYSDFDEIDYPIVDRDE